MTISQLKETAKFLHSLSLVSYFRFIIYFLASEEVVVLYSGMVQKWNNFRIKQDRSLVVTNLNIYNFKKKSKLKTFLLVILF